VWFFFFIDADTLLISPDDASPYSPEKRTRKPMGFPDSGIIEVAFESMSLKKHLYFHTLLIYA
jgi:hypothetical protein